MNFLTKAAGGAMLATLTMSGVSFGQTVDKKALTLDGAKKVIAAAVADAKSKNAPGAAIAVVDEGPRQPGPNTGKAENGLVRNIKDVKYGAAYSKVSRVISVTVTPAKVPQN